MSTEHINHADIAKFAEDKVNLPSDKAKVYREQVKTLRDKLETFLKEHPDFSLKKMMLSGSLAKGTALRSLNDIDVACYVSGSDVPSDIGSLIDYIGKRLLQAYPNIKSDQIEPQTYSVKISFKGTGLDIDVVPIIYKGDPSWYGDLISQEDGSLLETNIPFHLEFIRKRKKSQETHFAQVVRLVKFWARKMKNENEEFRFKSFMIELILAHLCDQGVNFSDYPEALQSFFTYIIKSDMKERIIFEDYYDKSTVGQFNEPIQIIDPVNAKNNASRLYTDRQSILITEAAMDAGDAIDAAMRAPTKQQTINYWQKVFGPTFQ